MKINNSKNRKNKGFTLIELIVVVSIILILSGFLVPKVLGYQDKAKQAKAVNTARQIFDTSMESYTETEGVFDTTKLVPSIVAVTGMASTEIKVTDNGGSSITVGFNSDTNPYRVIITALNNRFTVEKGATTGDKVYENKVATTTP